MSLGRVYIAGPMSYHPRFNFPAFDDAADHLRREGWEVVSPAELDDPATRAAAMASPDGDPAQYASATQDTRGDLLGRDIKIILDEVEGIVLLAGWEKSKGARLESFAGLTEGLRFYRYDPDCVDGVYEMSDEKVRLTLFAAPPDITLPEPCDQADSGCGWSGEAEPGVLAMPAGEVRVTDPNTGGEKGRKPERYDLIPFEAMDELARVFAFGAEKYEAHNYLRGYAWSLSLGALLRHVAQFAKGIDTDPETDCLHLAHAAWHCLALIMFHRLGLGTDDRWRPPTQEWQPAPTVSGGERYG